MSEDGSGRERAEERFARFNFIVDLGDGREGGFQEMSGIDTATPAVDYRRSRDPVFSAVKVPGLAALGHVVLKRGVMAGGEGFRAWRRAVLLDRIEPRAIRIRQRDEQGRPVMSWTLANARPLGISGADAKAGAADVAIESLEIVCESIASAGG